jgi:hypothetical protein
MTAQEGRMAAIDELTYRPKGDKKNSGFFEEYRIKIYERRKSSGIEDLLGNMRAIVIQVQYGDAWPYIAELHLMGPYKLAAVHRSETHKVYTLVSRPEFPRLIVLEPLRADYADEITMMNRLHPLSSPVANARYVGEIFETADIKETQRILEDQDIRFKQHHETRNPFFTESGVVFTFPSDFTWNRVGYTELDIDDHDGLRFGEKLEPDPQEKDRLARITAFSQEHGLDKLVLGVDHMATRILAGEREDAILEFLTLSKYYFWGAYNITEMNSSTNVTRNGHVDDDKKSPAKVFTANNTPSYINSFRKLPMPTENFVRNFGRRMHHMAYEVVDGNHRAGEKNVDYVVGCLRDEGVPFLAHVVGECLDDPNLKQIFSKHSRYSILITEYVERCHGYEGFFTRQNVASLTAAAGQDEQFHHGQIFD